MLEERINAESGKRQIKIEPKCLPAIWVDVGLCERCQPYNECLGFNHIDNKVWYEINALISSVHKEEQQEDSKWIS